MIQGPVFKGPDVWLAMTEAQRFGGLCDSDLCMTPNGDCFIRVVLEAHDPAGQLTEYGVWASVGPDDFRRYYETYNDLDQSKLGKLHATLANAIEGYDGSLGLKAILDTQDDGQRPLILLDASDHPLSLAQKAAA